MSMELLQMSSGLRGSEADRCSILAIVADAQKSFGVLHFTLDDGHGGAGAVYVS